MVSIIIIAVLAVIIVLAVHSIWKSHKNGHCCGCDGGQCSCCHGQPTDEKKEEKQK